ncbi:uncharacterized protein MONBRDRAFT_22646 [Monosiga brevicollis MX1]|uniref:Receptor L-domain domain-containing protein n=1 Tax=Monosiga brevicollis TaxID=81824 RepID=A9URM8_MONBE|nr:uncharacterized protein MONBRDRAFT_22646 [Monosiga brevicollis MX1]EDQ91953.1 predicted protein [Monosiga brevicollis MX1]|eukprot:XP_001743239.1 hypothetical protein [Monosiga brevicollis MX1]
MRWRCVTGGLLVVMGLAVVHAALEHDEPIIGVDLDGNLFINTSSSADGHTRRLLLNGVDVLRELTELRQKCAGNVPRTTTTAPSTVAASTAMPVSYTGTVGCQLESVPSNVTHLFGNVSLSFCPLLTAESLKVFNELVYVSGDLKIELNTNLTNVDGLGSITSVGDSFFINSNDALINVAGVGNITSVGGDVDIRYNEALVNVDGLGSITSVGGYLSIFSNPVLDNVDGLRSITDVGGYLSIRANAALTNVDGLGSITIVRGYLGIYGNDALTNVDGLGNITSVEGTLHICSNSQLDTSTVPESVRSLGTCQVITSENCMTC